MKGRKGLTETVALTGLIGLSVVASGIAYTQFDALTRNAGQEKQIPVTGADNLEIATCRSEENRTHLSIRNNAGHRINASRIETEVSGEPVENTSTEPRIVESGELFQHTIGSCRPVSKTEKIRLELGDETVEKTCFNIERDIYTNYAPNAIIESNPNVSLITEEINFDGTNSYDPENCGEPSGSYSWDFGDGDTAEEGTVTHNYTDTGYYKVELTVEDLKGKEDTETQTVSAIYGPKAVLEGPLGTVYVGETVEFDAGKTDSGNTSIEGYRFDLDGDGVHENVTDSETVDYTYENSYQGDAKVNVITRNDSRQFIANDTVTVDVQDPANPSAKLILEENVSTDALAVFKASQSSGGDGSIDSYRYDVKNDGDYENTTTDTVIDYRFKNEYKGKAELEVEDEFGQTDRDQTSVWITPAAKDINAGEFCQPDGSSSDRWIENVTVRDADGNQVLNRESSKDNGYIDKTDKIGSLGPDQEIEFEVKYEADQDCFWGVCSNYEAKPHIASNLSDSDGGIDDGLIASGPQVSGSQNTWTYTWTPPAGADGNHLIRFYVRKNEETPCSSNADGDTEDYTLHLGW